MVVPVTWLYLNSARISFSILKFQNVVKRWMVRVSFHLFCSKHEPFNTYWSLCSEKCSSVTFWLSVLLDVCWLLWGSHPVQVSLLHPIRPLSPVPHVFILHSQASSQVRSPRHHYFPRHFYPTWLLLRILIKP